ncbi:MAG TPA: hypothetical protein VKA46_07605 [Gemmataceae bacterium]|nr:hypothetical protein [Gemmataceae bacterium]
MSRLAIPVNRTILHNTGDVLLRAEVILALKDGAGNITNRRFRVDSATDVTTFPAFDARQLGLPMPVNTSPVRHNPTGLEVRSGLLRFRIDGMDQTEYAVSCFFLGNPNVAPNPAMPAFLPRALLQPLSLLDHLKFTMEKDPTSAAIYGEVIIEKK